MNLAKLKQRLTETMDWCDGRARLDDLRGSLRSPDLRPAAPLGDAATVADVARRRAEAMRDSPRAIRAQGGDRAGRLLVFDPGQSLSDGAAAAETGELFDDDNAPPWDTWVAHVIEQPRSPDRWTAFDSYLLCWMPNEVIALADRAISVNPEQCIRWASAVDRPLLRALRRAGVIE